MAEQVSVTFNQLQKLMNFFSQHFSTYILITPPLNYFDKRNIPTVKVRTLLWQGTLFLDEFLCDLTKTWKGVGSPMPKIGPVDSQKIVTLIPPAVQNFSACLTFLLSASKLI